MQKKTCTKPNSKTVRLQELVISECTYCAQLCYAIQHRTLLIIFPLILQTDNHHNSNVANKGEGQRTHLMYKHHVILSRCSRFK